jgi:carbamoyl-phosphate synthase large subunit
VNKVKDGRPHIVDLIKNGEISLVFTTVDETRTAIADSRSIRTSAQANNVTYYTTISAARAVMDGLMTSQNGNKESLEVYSLQNLHKTLN